jgi:hypothetical protein
MEVVVLFSICQPFFSEISGRRFCRTAKGRLGSVPEWAKLGDRICIFHGGRVPFVIRPCGDGTYTHVSDCYLHGVKDGEAMDMADLIDVEFTLV